MFWGKVDGRGAVRGKFQGRSRKRNMKYGNRNLEVGMRIYEI
jgi:hypothetical protein